MLSDPIAPPQRGELPGTETFALLHGGYPDQGPGAAEYEQPQVIGFRLGEMPPPPALPPFPVPEGHGDEMAYLRELTYAGAAKRYGPRGTATDKAYAQLEHELGIIEQLGFPGYFLVVWELVEFCRREGILCQGRGSAANSAVCYALGVTAVDAIRYELLFERFLSPERDGPPDIDVDIESDRREEVIQHVYATHGREYAAQVANVVVTWNLSTRMIVPSSLNHGLERSLSGTVVLEMWPVLVRHEQAAAWLQLWIDLGGWCFSPRGGARSC